MTHANLPLIRKVWEWVKEQDELRKRGRQSEWDQGTWYEEWGCGTACCIAGKVALMEPNLIRINSDMITYKDETRSIVSEDIPEYATHTLGLDECVACELFSASNDLDAVESIFIEIFDSEGERL